MQFVTTTRCEPKSAMQSSPVSMSQPRIRTSSHSTRSMPSSFGTRLPLASLLMRTASIVTFSHLR